MGDVRWYRVSGTITISVFTDVLARGEHEAAELAELNPVMSLCHQCAGGEEKKEWVTSGELDGEPEVHDAELTTEMPSEKERARYLRAAEKRSADRG
jgi:hypothetical protein